MRLCFPCVRDLIAVGERARETCSQWIEGLSGQVSDNEIVTPTLRGYPGQAWSLVGPTLARRADISCVLVQWLSDVAERNRVFVKAPGLPISSYSRCSGPRTERWPAEVFPQRPCSFKTAAGY